MDKTDKHGEARSPLHRSDRAEYPWSTWQCEPPSDGKKRVNWQ
ncbi:hypothetical protein [Zarconia navalis]|nr:hypothetical protein [Zarconia navalis]